MEDIMKEKRMIISIGRECGSGGHEIGEKLARHYGINFYDKNLINELAERKNMDPEKLSALEEKVSGYILPVHKGGFEDKSLMDKMTESDKLFLMEKALIKELAEKESFVIVGRAANAILENDENTLHLYVYAPESFKIPRVKEFYHLDTDREARKKMLKVDKGRSQYFNFYTNRQWGSPDDHDFMINSAVFGIDGTVRLIIDLADGKFNSQKVS